MMFESIDKCNRDEIKEAIEILRDTPIDLRSPREDDIHIKYATAMLMAQEALEKRIPKKPSLSVWNGVIVYDTWQCPCCSAEFDIETEDYEHCADCGQAIDWSEVEE